MSQDLRRERAGIKFTTYEEAQKLHAEIAELEAEYERLKLKVAEQESSLRDAHKRLLESLAREVFNYA